LYKHFAAFDDSKAGVLYLKQELGEAGRALSMQFVEFLLAFGCLIKS
jgi:hypothetical protein